ncbi:hypothetical protein TRIP_B250038 [uncultured Desulfatiglans sp.]|nr:hypothetical protein TRIP_B250038 [uncultured Desulfatiglans sp.]
MGAVFEKKLFPDRLEVTSAYPGGSPSQISKNDSLVIAFQKTSLSEGAETGKAIIIRIQVGVSDGPSAQE